jgi:hypothetical protein
MMVETATTARTEARRETDLVIINTETAGL